jgi:hypothetical protein
MMMMVMMMMKENQERPSRSLGRTSISLQKENARLNKAWNELHGTTLQHSQFQEFAASLLEMYTGHQGIYGLNVNVCQPFETNVCSTK